MSANSTNYPQQNHETQDNQARLKKSLRLRHVVIIGLAYLTPMTVFDSFVIVSEKSHGHVPSAYILALIAVLFTAISYGILVRQFPQAGSAYTYAQKSINPHIGFMVGWLSLMDYMLLPMINVLLVKIYLSAMFPIVPEWIWVVGCVLIMTVSNLRGVNWVANFNTLLVFAQIAILSLFIYFAWQGLHNGAGSGTILSIKPFFSEKADLMPIIAGATILCFSFLGFDAVTTLSEETYNAKYVIPKAIFLTALYGGVIFISISFFIQLYFPDLKLLQNPDNSLPDIALYVGGKLFQVTLLVCAVIGALASGIASHASISRLLYVMGRDRVFSRKIFGYVHPTWYTPAANIIIVGLVALSAYFFDLETAITLINFGALIAFTFVNLSVISFFFIKQQRNRSLKDIALYLVSPSIGALMIGILWLNLAKISLILGITWGALGFLYMLYLTKGFSQPLPKMTQTDIPLAE